MNRFEMVALSGEDFLAQQLSHPQSGWSLGTFGAVAEFSSVAGEKINVERSAGRIKAVTSRGGMSISTDGCRLFASESLAWQGWTQRVSLCLKSTDARTMNCRSVLTELGPDTGALRSEDRRGILFDLGLGVPHVDFNIRVDDPDLCRELRSHVGKPLYETDNPALSAILDASPHRVFISRVGRIEVFQRIPKHGEKSPDGPHTHVLPRLLSQKRTHAATEPVPEGWIPCAHVYPWHPADVSLGRKPSFNFDQHSYLQAILRSFGDPGAITVKDRTTALVISECSPPTRCFARNRFDRANIRIALRQLKAGGCGSRELDKWLAAYDRPNEEEREICSTK